ncbi:hypothetical protein B0O80DRAFT_239934 [Mortierella sp. GBAus27b]|nr:hypothetical protein B0O80DRAFT_239934 [Mortierella sp. GBAus27b]
MPGQDSTEGAGGAQAGGVCSGAGEPQTGLGGLLGSSCSSLLTPFTISTFLVHTHLLLCSHLHHPHTRTPAPPHHLRHPHDCCRTPYSNLHPCCTLTVRSCPSRSEPSRSPFSLLHAHFYPTFPFVFSTAVEQKSHTAAHCFHSNLAVLASPPPPPPRHHALSMLTEKAMLSTSARPSAHESFERSIHLIYLLGRPAPDILRAAWSLLYCLFQNGWPTQRAQVEPNASMCSLLTTSLAAGLSSQPAISTPDFFVVPSHGQ